MAQVCSVPAEIWANWSPPATRVGAGMPGPLGVEPVPSGPKWPQQYAWPLLARAQVCWAPTVTWVQTAPAAVTAGVGDGSVGAVGSSWQATRVRTARSGTATMAGDGMASSPLVYVTLPGAVKPISRGTAPQLAGDLLRHLLRKETGGESTAADGPDH